MSNEWSLEKGLMSFEISQMALGIERVQKVHEILGSPAQTYKTVHVAGTNGKGSVTYKMACSLKAQGLRVGCFTSPHLFCPTERITVDENPITLSKLQQLTKQLECIDAELTYFEKMTLAALIYFKEQNVEWAVIEVGIGGRLDATNIILPELCIITTIGFDHQKWLGESLEEIAYEKAGIIKPNTPVVVGATALVSGVIESFAKKMRAPFYALSPQSDYMLENQMIAEKGLEVLGFTSSEVKKVPLCRFTRFKIEKELILDVAHNPQGIEALLLRLKKFYPHETIAIIAGFSRDKEVDKMKKMLESVSVYFLPQSYPDPRSYFINTLSFEENLTIALQKAEVVVVCGTFFIFGEVFSVLQKKGAERLDDQLYKSG